MIVDLVTRGVGIPNRQCKLKLQLPEAIDLENFFGWLWERFSSAGLLGVHEGTVLSSGEDGMVLDSAWAPNDRDWVAERAGGEVELFFSDMPSAQKCFEELRAIPNLVLNGVEEIPEVDWNAKWKESFTGIDLSPYWKILPYWKKSSETDHSVPVIWINPGAGFGTGTHETTQLCLQVVSEKVQKDWHTLDFGSGSGILSVASAIKGAKVAAIEIDAMAEQNARENARLNAVFDRIGFFRDLDEMDGKFNFVVANILKDVLLRYAEQLVSCVKDKGILVLSGLIEKDVPDVRRCYSLLLRGAEPTILEKNEWRALVFDQTQV
jgi:ribosomal protein L11 methyltransferase